MSTPITTENRLEKIGLQLERIVAAVVKGFDNFSQELEQTRDVLRGQIDIYARAVDAYAKQSETYMQEMLALGNKVDRLERQIEQIATHLKIKLSY